MNTFDWLLIGHLVGDWLLQNDWMAKNKKCGLVTLPGLVHFTIYTLTIIGGLYLAGVRDSAPLYYFGLGTIVFVSHWLIDTTQVVNSWMRLFHQSDLEWVHFLVDQTYHLLVLVMVTCIIR